MFAYYTQMLENMEINNQTEVIEEEVYCISSTVRNKLIAAEFANPSRMSAIPDGVFKSEWQKFPEFYPWLRPVSEDKTKAWCRACDKMFKADLKSLRVHGVGKCHIQRVQTKFPKESSASATPPPVAYNVITDRKGTYGIGILSKPDNCLPVIPGNSLYVDPTNPNSIALTCDRNEGEESLVVVCMPKGGRKRKYQKSDGNEISNPEREITKISDDLESSIVPVLNNKFFLSTFEECSAEELVATEDVYDFENGIDKLADHILDDDRGQINRMSNNDDHRINNTNSFNYSNRAVVCRPAPFWKSAAVIDGNITELQLSDYLGRYLVMFFYPRDFSDLCPNELNSLSDQIKEFHAINADVVACSVDSVLVHQAWARVSRSDGGIAFPKLALLSDATHAISRNYGCMLHELGHAFRAHYIIDTKGIVRHLSISDVQVARSINEILRLIQAFQHADQTETNCPVGWKPGDNGIS